MNASSTLLLLLCVFVVGYGVGRHRNPICWWDGFRLRLLTGKRVDGHIYSDLQRLDHCIVTTAKCDRCDEWNVAWEPTGGSVATPYRSERASVRNNP